MASPTPSVVEEPPRSGVKKFRPAQVNCRTAAINVGGSSVFTEVDEASLHLSKFEPSDLQFPDLQCLEPNHVLVSKHRWKLIDQGFMFALEANPHAASDDRTNVCNDVSEKVRSHDYIKHLRSSNKIHTSCGLSVAMPSRCLCTLRQLLRTCGPQIVHVAKSVRFRDGCDVVFFLPRSRARSNA